MKKHIFTLQAMDHLCEDVTFYLDLSGELVVDGRRSPPATSYELICNGHDIRVESEP
ncbi:MAG TPA: hypothetical protein PKY30_13675 [Myxococcota bacterium]|nr:hypothetical protein [Myxococcota bacterium]